MVSSNRHGTREVSLSADEMSVYSRTFWSSTNRFLPYSYQALLPNVVTEDPALRVSYAFFKKPGPILLATLFGLMIYYVLGYAFRPENFTLEGVSLIEVIGLFIVDQFLIECVSFFILFRIVAGYARLFNLNRIELSFRSLAAYQVAFIPVASLAFFIFYPFTYSLRYLFRYFGEYNWGLYWSGFFNWPVYFTYLGVLVPVLYLSLNLNLIGEYRKHVKALSAEKRSNGTKNKFYLQRIVGNLQGAQQSLHIRDVLWFEIKGRTYFAVTETGCYRISQTLTTLNDELDPTHFFRLNRSVIANISGIESFSPWIDGKYTVQMKDGDKTEFTLSRNRVKQFKRYVGAG